MTVTRLYSPTLATQVWDENDVLTAPYQNAFKADPEIMGGHLRLAGGEWTNGTDTTTVPDALNIFAMFTMKSSDVLWDLYVYGNDVETSTTFDLGVYNFSPSDGVGSVVDKNYFGTLLTVGDVTSARVSAYEEALSPNYGRSRGITLAEHLGEPDKGQTYAICFTAGFAFGINIADFMFGAYAIYTSGD